MVDCSNWLPGVDPKPVDGGVDSTILLVLPINPLSVVGVSFADDWLWSVFSVDADCSWDKVSIVVRCCGLTPSSSCVKSEVAVGCGVSSPVSVYELVGSDIPLSPLLLPILRVPLLEYIVVTLAGAGVIDDSVVVKVCSGAISENVGCGDVNSMISVEARLLTEFVASVLVPVYGPVSSNVPLSLSGVSVVDAPMLGVNLVPVTDAVVTTDSVV